jgi:energy-coupling factor transporter ATP-binding protein EcfA2
MDINKINELVQLASIADMLDNKSVQNMIHAIGLDDDRELMDDAREYFGYNALGKLTSPIPFDKIPPGVDISGEIELGEASETKSPFGLDIEEMTQHVLLAGMSGSGKTTILYNMMNQLLQKRIPFFCFDFKKEFRGYVRKSDNVLILRPENFKLNPLRPPEGIPPSRWISIFSDVFCHSTSLLEGSNSFLLDQLNNLYKLWGIFNDSDEYPSFHELEKILHHIYIPLSSREARYLESVRNRVTSCILNAGDMLKCDRDMFKDLIEQKKSVIFEFYGISEHVTSFLIELILTKLYFYRMAKGREHSKNNPLVVFMDEGRNVYDYRKEQNIASGIPIIDTITERIRDFNVSLTICTQIPSEICVSAKSNTYTKIMMGLGNGEDISNLAKCMGLDKNQEQYTYGLKVGNAIVKLAGKYTTPFWIITPPVNMDKDVSDYELKEKMDPILTKFNVSPVVSSPLYNSYIDCLNDRKRTKKKEEAISDIVRNLLTNIFTSPYIPMSERYDNLRLNRVKGKLAKDFVIENKYVTEVNIKVNNSIYNFLVLTKKGLSFCEEQGLKDKNWNEIVGGKLSFRHKFYQNLMKNYLVQDGWKVHFEHPVNGDKRTNVNKKVDLVADYEIEGKVEKSIAVEVVLSNYEVYTLMNCVDNGFDEIRVICKDETARKRIENDIYGAIDEMDRDSVIVQTINGFLGSMPQKP